MRLPPNVTSGSVRLPDGTVVPWSQIPDGYLVIYQNDQWEGLDPATLGGGGSPGGSNKQLQYNNAGAFGGAANLTVEGGRLRHATADEIAAIATPTAPASGYGATYMKALAGRILPHLLRPAGPEVPISPAWFARNIRIWFPSPTRASANGDSVGWACTGSGTSTTQAPAAGTFVGSMLRQRYTTTTVANNAAGLRSNYQDFYRGANAREGGFFFWCRFAIRINSAGSRAFVGLCSNSSPLGGEPSLATNHTIGVGFDSGDSAAGNWQIIRADGAASAKVDAGANAPRDTSTVYDLFLFSEPNGSATYVMLVNLSTQTIVIDTSYSTTLPGATQMLYTFAQVGYGASASGVGQQIEIIRKYIETEF